MQFSVAIMLFSKSYMQWLTEHVICNLSVSFGKYLEKGHPVKLPTYIMS
jgi:hypothetical protein